MKPDLSALKQLLFHLPETPGVYQFFDSSQRLIYVGKAKNIRKRVTSYFRPDHDSGKTKLMVSRITDIKFIVVETELDALLLENNLIKKHQPRYNVALKDDKTFPWICIKNERFPRVFPTRTLVRDGSEYFGPYASVRMMNTLLDLIRRLYKLRNCNFNLSEENVERKKFRLCLEYQIGNCKGPCEGLQAEEDYNRSVAGIREILKGNIGSVIGHLKQLMNDYASRFDYENAQRVKEKIELLERYRSKSVVVNPAIKDADVFSFLQEDGRAYVNYMKVINGAILQSHTIELKKKLDESPEELLSLAITELRLRFHSEAPDVMVPFLPEMELPGVEFVIPKIGDKKHLLDLSEKNLKYFVREKILRQETSGPLNRTQRMLVQAQHDLRLKELPLHIECFDNSNIQGEFPVAAMSVFQNGRPSKKDYRLFNIRTVEGPDDFASMEEVIYRRYKRLLEEGCPLPQLIIIDGGKGQLSSALTSLEKLGLRGKIGIIGIAKKLEEIYYPGDSLPMYLDKKSETLMMIQHLRDEAHRFGLKHHRNRRSRGMIKTELSGIKGIGQATAEKLLRHFKSVKGLKEASAEQIAGVVGKSRASLLLQFLHHAKENNSAKTD